MVTRTGLTIIFVTIVCAAPALTMADDAIFWDFEAPTTDWQPSPIDPGSVAVAVSTERATEAWGSLKIQGTLPQGFGATYRPWRNWETYTQLSFDIFIPADVPKDFDLQVYLKDRHYYWFQTHPYRTPDTSRPTGLRRPGKWAHITIDLGPRSTQWEPAGHGKPWYDATYLPREFGFRFFGSAAGAGAVYIDNLAIGGHQPPLGRFDRQRSPAVAYNLQPTVNQTTVPQYEKFEVTWPVQRRYTNPYDPQVVDVQGHFLGPDGTEVVVPGFYYQDFQRHRTEEGYEALVPAGQPCWKVRFAPRQQGEYRYYVSVNDAQGERRCHQKEFVAAPPLHPEGYVRVSRSDPHYFELDNGQCFYPLAINMRDGGDQAEAQPGTYAFDHFFPLFEREGIDLVRTWMCAWWGGIEGSDNYHSRFSGLGRYSMYNAWRLDYAVDLAARHDLCLQISFNRHGQLRRDKFDAEWKYNPFSVDNGGFLPSPAMFFTSERVKELFRQRYRYTVARWGYSRNIMAWELWNEVDLVEGYRPGEVAAWHAEMADYLRRIDPWQHIITTHICLYWSFGDEMWRRPEIEFIQADSYWKRRDEGMNQAFLPKMGYNKPFIFIEYGPKTAELPVPESRWLQEFRCGMWVSAMMPWSAPAAFWYHEDWEKYRLYEYQRALAAFNQGEDRRGRNLRLAGMQVQPDDRLDIQAMQNDTSAYFYVYNYDNLGRRDLQQTSEPISGGQVTLIGLQDGTYTVEFWDTLEGTIRDQTTLQVNRPVGPLLPCPRSSPTWPSR